MYRVGAGRTYLGTGIRNDLRRRNIFANQLWEDERMKLEEI